NSVVKHNFVDTFCQIKSDGGGIYSFDMSASAKSANRKVINNIVLNAVGSKGGVPISQVNYKPLAEGIFLDDNSNGIEISGNTVAHVRNNRPKMSNVSDVIVKNNTFFDASTLLALGNNALGRETRRVTVEGNIFFSK